MQVENKLPAITAGLSKTQIAELAKFGVDYVLETGQPELVAEQISVMENYIKAVKADERFTDYVREELAKNGGKITTASGAKVETMEGGTKYHFENCNDPVLAALYLEREMLDAGIKKREAFCKAIDEKGEDFVNLETGEAYKIYPPYKTSTSTYKVTLAK
jgi:hypothetical protein